MKSSAPIKTIAALESRMKQTRRKNHGHPGEGYPPGLVLYEIVEEYDGPAGLTPSYLRRMKFKVETGKFGSFGAVKMTENKQKFAAGDFQQSFSIDYFGYFGDRKDVFWTSKRTWIVEKKPTAKKKK